MKNEIWKSIFLGTLIEVSSLGNVKEKNKFKKLHNCRGYKYISIYKKGVIKNYSVHRLVLLVFDWREDHKKLQAAHLNGNRSDNRLENLIWATAKENDSHKDLHGRRPKGSKHGQSKLHESDIPKILNLKKQGLTYRQIAKKFKVTHLPIVFIVQGKTWRHVAR